ncbi:MAG: phospho-N-acetylmuramoyl-pentapeptide-transferase, partial [Cyclobacteriaceae bacterium]|nr:phospho-N-acetylmuramoyl-pentapeptide-transferase [Cyclobacteriaceae bacterium]
MLYYLFDYLDKQFDVPGAGVFQYISFRAGMAAFLSLLITIFFGKSLISLLKRKQVGEDIRDLGLEGQLQKKGTPTMGGLIIIAAILLPTLLFAKPDNIYVILLITATVWMGFIGFVDDYIKVFRKDKKGLAGRFKIVGQLGLGLIVGLTLFFHHEVVVREVKPGVNISQLAMTFQDADITAEQPESPRLFEDVKSTTTTIPFVKNNEFDYANLLPASLREYTWIIYVGVVIL